MPHENVKIESVACDPAFPAELPLPSSPSAAPLIRRATAMPKVVHVQQIDATPNPFYGPYEAQGTAGTFKCYVKVDETKQAGSVQLVRVYDEAQTTPLGWGRVMGRVVHVYEAVEGE